HHPPQTRGRLGAEQVLWRTPSFFDGAAGGLLSLSGLAADRHDLLVSALDGDDLIEDRGAVPGGDDLISAGAESELLRAGARENQLFAIDAKLDGGVVDLDYQGSLGCRDAKDRANHGGDHGEAVGLGGADPGQEQQKARRDGPASETSP